MLSFFIMKLLEKVLVLLCLAGTVLQILRAEIFTSVVAYPLLAAYYIPGYFFLLTGIRKPFSRRSYAGLRWREVATGIGSGLGAAYVVIAIFLHQIYETGNEDLLLNCAILLGIITAVAWLLRRRTGRVSYFFLLKRLAILSLCVVAEYLLRRWVIPHP